MCIESRLLSAIIIVIDFFYNVDMYMYLAVA